jgi:hypothetical protein
VVPASTIRISSVSPKYSGDDPYVPVSLNSISGQDLKVVSADKLTALFELYLRQSEPRNYPRIGWLLRRLWQVGAPGAVDYVLENINELTPVLGDVARYIARASLNYSGDLESVGMLIIDALDLPLIKRNEYVQMSLLNLFARVPQLNHINSLTAQYQDYPASSRREIVVAAGVANQGHWIKERKDEFVSADQWFRRAFIYAAHSLPGDEGLYWLRKTKNSMTGMEELDECCVDRR